MSEPVRISVRCFGNVDVPVPDGLRVLGDGQTHDPERGEFVFCILTPRDGDKRILWNRRSIAEVNDARKMFDDLVAQGMTPHRVGTNGEPAADVLTSFDPILEEISFLDAAEERALFPGSSVARRVVGGAEVVFLPRRQIVGG
jgi:hypothetical protein